MNRDVWGDPSGLTRGEVAEVLDLSRNVNRELAHLLVGIAVQSAGLQRQLPNNTESESELAAYLAVIETEAWRGFAATDRAEGRFRCLLGPVGSKASGAAS